MKDRKESILKKFITSTMAKTAVKALAVLVVFVTTYMLIMPAFTLDGKNASKQGGIDVPELVAMNQSDKEPDGKTTEASKDAAKKEPKGESAEVSSEKSDQESKQNSSGDSADKAAGDQSDKSTEQSTDQSDKSTDGTANDSADETKATTGELSFAGENYTVAITDDKEKLPAATELKVEEIKSEQSDYIDLYNDAIKAISDKDGKSKASAYTAAKLFDITLLNDGDKVEPENTLDVKITFDEAVPVEGKNVRIVHFAEDPATGKVTPEVLDRKTVDVSINDHEMTEAEFKAPGFSVYAIVYTVDFSFDVDGKTYEFSMDGADSVSLRDLVKVLHIYEKRDSAAAKADADDASSEQKNGASDAPVATDNNSDDQTARIDAFMADISDVTFSDPKLLVPAKVEEDTTVGKIKTNLKLFPTYPLGLTQDEVLALNAKEYKEGDWALISMKPFDTEETLTIAFEDGESIEIKITDAQDAIMNGDQVQTIANPAGTTIDLFDYWVVSQNLVGRDGWGDLNQSQGAAEAGDDKPLNGTGNNKGINSSTSDADHGHALKFTPAWAGTVYNGNKIGTTGNAWQSVNLDGRTGLNSYTGNGNPFQGIVQGTLVDGYPVLTENGTIGSTGESLSYLFDTSTEHAGKASYPGVNQLMYVDKAGYYTYDSRDYAAQYNEGSNTFTVTEQTSNNTEIRGFWPFGIQNFWSGMHLNTQFSMPSGGQVLNPVGEYKDMQFEFSGDDDTWLYVDGVLVGDGGGIHNRTEIDINFAAGTVTVTGKKDTYHAGDFEETRYLDDFFKEAGRYPEAGSEEESRYWEDIPGVPGHKRFKSGTYHTFDMFYLERGGGESNLYIHYNLVSTADFTGHKSYYGADEDDRLHRDWFKFELVGLDGKYHYSDGALVADPTGADARAIMPDHSNASSSNPGTIAEPFYDGNTSTTLKSGETFASQTYITSATEDGNINFGSATISQQDMNEADNGNPPVYRYIIRESVPDDAVNSDGVTWGEATDAQKAAGGFIKDEIQYDGNVFYMTAEVTSWTETTPSGQTVIRHGLRKTYYTDDTFTTRDTGTSFVHFDNRHVIPKGSADFTKVKEDGEPLPGAKFGLYRDEACTIPATDMEQVGRPHITAVAGADGKVAFENIRRGTYYMKEIVAPGDYALDDTIYKVVIVDSHDKTQESKITILGDASETPVTEIVNTKQGELTVVKKWLNAAGQEISGGSNSVTVQLKRKYMEPHVVSESHSVTVQMTVEDGGVQYGTPVTTTIHGSTAVIEWDDEWQRNFNWWLKVGDKSYEGWIGGEFVEGENYTFEQIDNAGRSRRLTIRNIDGDVELTTKYWVNWLHSDNNHWTRLNSPVITDSGPDISYTAEEDTDFNNANHTQVLNSSGWSHKWTLGGTESSHAGFDYPEKDDNNQKYLYYVVELGPDGEPLEIGGNPVEGFVLDGYSTNNSIGVSTQGLITVYNKKENSGSVNVDILKTDDAPNSTNFLEGAVFRLEYKADASGTWERASSVPGLEIEELDTNSCFTVPETGITLTGLTDGQYRLVEITPPEGYVIIEENPVTFTVSDGAITSTEGTIDTVRYTAATQTANAEFIIPNTFGAELPESGGIGTTIFYILGSILAFGCGVVLVARRRSKVV